MCEAHLDVLKGKGRTNIVIQAKRSNKKQEYIHVKFMADT